jgi:hypothetical protein
MASADSVQMACTNLYYYQLHSWLSRFYGLERQNHQENQH